MGFIRRLDDYGGPMANYADVVDPNTDEDAKFRNRYACDTAMLTHVSPVAIFRFITVAGGAPTEPTFVHDARWGNSAFVKPIVARTGTGVWTVTWPSLVDDDMTQFDPSVGGGVQHSVNFRTAEARATPVAGVLKHAAATVTAPNIITVNGYLANGTADDIAGSTVTVFAY